LSQFLNVILGWRPEPKNPDCIGEGEKKLRSRGFGGFTGRKEFGQKIKGMKLWTAPGGVGVLQSPLVRYRQKFTTSPRSKKKKDFNENAGFFKVRRTSTYRNSASSGLLRKLYFALGVGK